MVVSYGSRGCVSWLARAFARRTQKGLLLFTNEMGIQIFSVATVCLYSIRPDHVHAHQPTLDPSIPDTPLPPIHTLLPPQPLPTILPQLKRRPIPHPFPTLSPQQRIPHRIPHATQTRIPFIIHRTIFYFPHLPRLQKTPNLAQPPIHHRMHPHKIRPLMIRPIKMRQSATMRIRPPRPHKDRLDTRSRGQIRSKGIAEGDAVAAIHMGLEIEVVLLRTLLHKARHSWKGVLGSCINARYTRRELPPVKRR